MKMNCKFLFVSVFVACSVAAKLALAAQIAVGGSQGWDPSTDFDTWTSGQKFKVGDQLVFKYSSGLHSVVELGSESAYKNCDLSTTVNSMSTGNDAVKLNKAGTRYFACGTSGHCQQGMKVKITTDSGSAPSTPDSTTTSTSASRISAVPGSFAVVFFLAAAVFGQLILF